MTPTQIAALRAVSERCRQAGSKVWLEPAAVDALLWSLEDAKSDAGFKQAQIDRLMFEFCPNEMTPEQVAEWAIHKVPVKLEA